SIGRRAWGPILNAPRSTLHAPRSTLNAQRSTANARERGVVRHSVAHRVIDVLHYLAACEEKAAALPAHRSALHFHDGERAPREAAEEIGKEARREVAARKLERRGGIGLRPVRAIDGRHGISDRSKIERAPAQLSEKLR